MADMALTSDEQQLLSDVKIYLHVIWQDENTDINIIGYIKRGKARLQQIAGVPLDFTTEDLARTLLLDYCRYANSQALEMFEKNFGADLLELNLQNQFKTPGKLTVVSAASTSIGYTNIKVSPHIDDGDIYMYKLGAGIVLPGFFDICDTVNGYIEWNGTDEIQATAGNDIILVEVDEDMKAIRAGKTAVVVG